MNARCSLVYLATYLASGALLGGCDVYDRQTGDFMAGSVDPVNFPAEFLGTGGNGMKPGSGYFLPVAASVGGSPLQNGTAQGYFPFAFVGPQTMDMAMNPLLVGGSTGFSPPLGYPFDPNPNALPGPMKGMCIGPANYVFQQQTDAVHYDEQGSILTDLPDDTANYTPLVAEVPVTSDGEDCQSIVDEQTLLTSTDVIVPEIPANPQDPNSMPTGKPDGNYLAWVVIDPAARVMLTPTDDTSNTMLYYDGLQSWGWYNHYLAAYLDGGYVITMPAPGGGAQIVPQRLYYPTTIPDGMGGTMPGMPSMGYDILQQARTINSGGGTMINPMYTPVCEVWSFDPVNPMVPLTSETDVMDMAKATNVTDTMTAIYCIQLYSTLPKEP